MPFWIQIIFRCVFFFIITWFLIRLMGKRNMADITPFQFVNYLVIGTIAALISAGMIKNLIVGSISLVIWALLPILLNYASMKSNFIHDWFFGRETILISHGKVLEENLAKVKLTGDELLRSLRSKNIFSVSDVEFALMENTGDINVLLKSEKRPVVSKDIGRKISPGTEPQTVILDGNIINDALTRIGLNQDWLEIELRKAGVALDNVFIGQVDTFGELYLDLYDDAIQLPRPKVRELLYANLEKCQADLMSYVLETNNAEAKEMYLKNTKKLKEIKEKLEPYLLR
jgi:uncharacterized membrane protein YcaP (DUF421 family)